MPYEHEALTTRQAAQFLGAHVESIRRLARRGRIPAYKIGSDWRFNKDALRRWAETHHERSGKASILVVDDDEAVRHFVSRVFGQQGFTVSTAATGEEALELMRQEPPRLVFLDLRLGGMDGATVLKEIRTGYGALPVVIITGYPDSALMMQALRHAPVLMLPKPLEPEQLLNAARLVFETVTRSSPET